MHSFRKECYTFEIFLIVTLLYFFKNPFPLNISAYRNLTKRYNLKAKDGNT